MEFYSVIKNDRPTNEIFWQFMGEDFKNNSQLIVGESEEALFVKDGVVVGSFTGGKYNLDTANYPFLTALRTMFSGGVSAFNCKVYFVDKSHKLELYWGTDSPIQMRDAEFGFMVGVRVRGSYTLQIEDAKKFYLKMVGNFPVYTSDAINESFRTVFQQKIKVELATVMKNQNLTVLDMNTELDKIADEMTPKIKEVLSEYGIRLINFYVSDISIPENDPNYAQINQLYVNKAQIKVLGNDYDRLTAKELLKDIANNPGAGGIAAAGAGLGMGMASGGIFNSLANQAFSSMNQNNPQANQQPRNRASRFAPKQENTSQSENIGEVTCSNCGSNVSKNNKFCPECGSKLNAEYICKNCGETIIGNSKFCGNCGARRD